MTPRVAIIMGSRSDLRVMQAAADTLDELGVDHDVDIVSAHRTPQRLWDWASSAESRGLRVVIAGAGGAAHLPGMVASLSLLPVIGVPVSATVLQGEDALLSIAQMPAGIPVATVAIDNATNAALLAARMLAPQDPALRERLGQHREAMAARVLDAAATLRRDA